MEFSIATEELSKALHRAQGIAERKAAIPILANVLIRAKENGVSFTAFNLDIALVSEHPAEVKQEGAVTLSSKHLFDIVRSLPEAKVLVKSGQNNTVEIISGSARMKLLGMPAEEYPSLPKEEKSNLVKTDGKVLLDVIGKTHFAIATDDTRYNLVGLFFESPAAGKVKAVATDGHRLNLVEKSLDSNFSMQKGVIIPRKGLLELKKVIEEAPDAECFLGFGETSAVFKKSGLSMIIRLLDGQFPEYQEVIPKNVEISLTLHRDVMLQTVKRISLLSEEKSHAIRIELANNLMRVSSNNPDLGEGHEDIFIEYSGNNLSACFNARYLTDVLGAMDSQEIDIQLTDDQSPCVLRPKGDQSYIAVIMPMRI